MDVRTLAVVARAGIEALKFTKKKREAEEKARLEKEAAKAKAQAEKEAEAERERLAAEAEAEAAAKAEAEAKAKAEAEAAEAEKAAAEQASAQAQPQESAATEAESAAASQAEATEAVPVPEASEEAKPQPAPEVEAESQPAAASEAKAEAKPQAEAKSEATKMETKSADASPARQKRKYRPALIRWQALGSLLSGVIFLGLFSVYLVTEVVTAMAVYIYLATYQADFLDFLDKRAIEFVGYIRKYLEQFFPHLDQQNLDSMFSKLGSRAVLLLFLALATSAAIRFLLWGTGVVLDGLRVQAEQAPKSSPPKAQSSEAKSSAS